jgi:hypothetical protein
VIEVGAKRLQHRLMSANAVSTPAPPMQSTAKALVLEIGDSGPGIPRAQRATVF